MSEISVALIKKLRELTSAGMMDCKKALNECLGDMEKAVDWLRQKGLSQVAKRADRAASEGKVSKAMSSDNKNIALVEFLCETDFVARSDKFQDLADKAAQIILEKNPENTAALELLIADELNALRASIGENMFVGRICRQTLQGNGILASYIHSNNKLGVIVEILCENPGTAEQDTFKELGKNIAMQIAAANPQSIDPESLDQNLIAREREVQKEKTLAEGKPANMVDKIVDGRMIKYYQEICLLEQPYIREDKKNIKQLLAEAGKELGDNLKISRFIRLQLGESQQTTDKDA